MGIFNDFANAFNGIGKHFRSGAKSVGSAISNTAIAAAHGIGDVGKGVEHLGMTAIKEGGDVIKNVGGKVVDTVDKIGNKVIDTGLNTLNKLTDVVTSPLFIIAIIAGAMVIIPMVAKK